MNTPSQVDVGVNLQNLRAGSLVEVVTKSRQYQIECLGGDSFRICGHPEYCPEPVPARLEGIIAPGKHLKFVLDHCRPVTTTRIVSFHVDPPKSDRTISSLSVH